MLRNVSEHLGGHTPESTLQTRLYKNSERRISENISNGQKSRNGNESDTGGLTLLPRKGNRKKSIGNVQTLKNVRRLISENLGSVQKLRPVKRPGIRPQRLKSKHGNGKSDAGQTRKYERNIMHNAGSVITKWAGGDTGATWACW